LREGLGTSLIAVMRLDGEYDATIAWLHDRLDDTTYDAIWSEGCGISMDQALHWHWRSEETPIAIGPRASTTGRWPAPGQAGEQHD